MARKVIILFLSFLCSFSVVAFANDGGNLLDDKEYLTIKVVAMSDEAQIGGDLELKITLINNTADDIKLIYINRIFANIWVDHSSEVFYTYEGLDVVVEPGKEAIIELKTKVPENIYWYEENDEYFFDIDFQIVYDGVFGDGNYATWQYVNAELKPNKIQITNLFDGSDYLDMSLINDEDTVVFMDDIDNNTFIYDGEMPAAIHNRVVVTNIGDKEIKNLYIRNNAVFYWNNNEYISLDLLPNAILIKDVINGYYINPKNIKRKIAAEYKALFQVDERYYAYQIEKEFDTKILAFPEIELRVKDDKTVDIKNISNTDYEDIYIDFEHNIDKLWLDEVFVHENFTFEFFKKGETINIPIDLIYNSYAIGFVMDDALYYWIFYPDIDITDDRPEKFVMSMEGEARRVELNKREDIIIGNMHTPEPTPSMTQKPTPTEKPTEIITPKITSIPTPTSTPQPTATKAPILTTPDVTQAVIIKNIETKSSLPIWVLLLLGTGLLCSGTLIYIIRKNQRFSE